MDTSKYMIIIKDEIKTKDVKYIQYIKEDYKYKVTYTNGSQFPYAVQNITWLKEPKKIELDDIKIFQGEVELANVTKLLRFSKDSNVYYHLFFKNNIEKDFFSHEILLRKSCFTNERCKEVFQYLKHLTPFVTKTTDKKENHIEYQYNKISFLSSDVVLPIYLNPQIFENKFNGTKLPIFPFGCNTSQIKAVKNALENKLSVIEGPPGTGKTQTILNIIANILIENKNVLVVSNNNSATNNIFEKLSSEKYNLGFLVAQLGNKDNKQKFIEKQCPTYPSMIDWVNQDLDSTSLKGQTKKLLELFSKEEELALAKQKYDSINIEKEHFVTYLKDKNINTEIEIIPKCSSRKFFNLLQLVQEKNELYKKLGFFFKLKIKYYISKNIFRLCNNLQQLENIMQLLFYKISLEEIRKRIVELEYYLSTENIKSHVTKMNNDSMKYLKSFLSKKYSHKGNNRKIFTLEDLKKNSTQILEDYPIILSSTHSALTSLPPETIYDYVIMDEASQVDVVTGSLSLACAKNIVIVGDTKQIPHIVKKEDEEIILEVFSKFNIPEHYEYTKNSFLKSICNVIPNLPRTLLREHYRCHPKIIQFCNQKFYNNELIIMTNNLEEENVLSVYKTTEGNHSRDHMNQRQLEVIQDEILPIIKTTSAEIGIITPYKNQVKNIQNILNDITTATVHSFQGQEKDVIIISTVDDKISDFVDNPVLLNVAVSRAKKQLFLVISHENLPKDKNIKDLMDYITYNNGTNVESKIYSIFDFLYKTNAKNREKYLKNGKKVSIYDSENLMFTLIKETLAENNLSSLDVIPHYNLSKLIKDTSILNEREKEYALHPWTHIDFFIYNKITKQPVLAIEVDGYAFHKKGSKQAERDLLKNHIFELYDIPFLRLSTTGSCEKERILGKINEL